MDELSAAELAARAGVSEGDVQRMVRIGVLRPRGSSSFRPADVQKIRLALACEKGGLPMDGIAAAIADGRLSFAFLDAAWYQRFPALSTQTLADAAAEAGVAVDVLGRTLEAFGYALKDADDPLREDELELLLLIRPVLSAGIIDEAGAVRFGRAISESLRRIARAENEIYHFKMEMPLLRSGLSQSETMEKASQMSNLYAEPLDRAIRAAYHRQEELATIEHLVEHIESALEESGLYRTSGDPSAMCFLDLEGYTRLTEERGDEEAARLADVLAGLVERRTREHGGQSVKWLGDGVMSYFREPTGAVTAAVEMVEDAPLAGLPRAHAGVAAGPVVRQAGDYFGRTVNMAARLSAFAGGGQVLVDQVVAKVAATTGITFREMEGVELKGVLEPVKLFEAIRSRAAS